MGSKDGRYFLLTADDMFFAYGLMQILTIFFYIFLVCCVNLCCFSINLYSYLVVVVFSFFLSICPVYLLLYQFIICMCTKFINVFFMPLS